MRKNHLLFLLTCCAALFSCSPDKNDIVELLSSTHKDYVIEGAIKAGENGNKEFVPLLLNGADDPRRSTNFAFKGKSVYQAKMEALSNIYKVAPPNPLTYDIDSSIIKFYTALYHSENGTK